MFIMCVKMEELTRIQNEYERRASDLSLVGRYSLFHPVVLHQIQGIERSILAALTHHGHTDLSEKRILDVGCGSGGWLRRFLSYGAIPEHLYGIDLLPDRIARAQALHPNIHFICGNATSLPFPDTTFDLVVTLTMFSSILDFSLQQSIACEMWRVLAPGGLLISYDFAYNNPRNQAVHAVNRGNMHRLFPAASLTFQKLTLAPPIARLLTPRLPLLSTTLESLNLFNTHLIATALKPIK